MTARHQQVADDLRRRIAMGELAIGQRLPPETQLATHYRVSTPTLRDALELLRVEGLVEKFQGRGNFVRMPSRRLAYPGKPGVALHVIVSSTEITASGDLATRLRARPDAPVTELVYLSQRDGSPHSLAHIYVPHVVARLPRHKTSASPWGDDVIDHLIMQADIPVATSTDQVTARFPTSAEAQSLRIAVRTPVLAIERTTTADNGVVIAFSLLVLPSDRGQVVRTTRIKRPANPPRGKEPSDD